jgi:DNA-binding response OmpR family regulator
MLPIMGAIRKVRGMNDLMDKLGINILVVEDDEDIRRQVSFALEAEDYNVQTCSNGKKAYDYLLSLSEEQYPNCIILDIMMPEMDGATLLKISHQNHKDTLGRIPVIVATAKGSLSPQEAFPYEVQKIQKPFDLEELYSKVETACRSR